MYAVDKRTAFSNEGFRVRRLNPDGTMTAVDNQLGFVETVDLTDAKATDKLSYRWDATGDFTDITVDLTAVGTNKIATVDNVVTALNLVEGFNAVLLASADSATGRLKLANATAVTGKKDLELKGTVAKLLGFGKSGDASAIGTAWVECFDDSGAVGLPKVMKDKEEIEQESGSGNIDTMIIDAINKGYSPSLALTDERYDLKECIDGGVYDETAKSYTPRTTDQPDAPLCTLEVFVAKYGKGSSHRGDAVGYKQYKVAKMSGVETDLAHEVKAWASYGFECSATEWIDSTGEKHPACVEYELTVAEAKALGVTA